ncbi:hypothetical protein CTI12_AA192940 [Artemisia annua]|uniref:KIB1-4 beta-propeller domain-containing protein n=1 Tax=Artemisia annua TaxID=35608 RepID=A0A2U1P532_ARTAN|nr:hypothetical protein CTI12_AA192940 [Artemisia annua]
MSYAKQVKKVTGGVDGFLQCLTCCNGKVYASVVTGELVVELSIVVKDTGVAINLLSLLEFPDPSVNGHRRRSYLVGTCKDIFCVYLDLDEAAETVDYVYLFKLDMNSKTWEELEDLKDATISLEIDNYLYPQFHSGSELGGYIHIILSENGRIYSYHVKDKTISLSSMPCCLVGTSHVSTWAMLECQRLLEGNHKQEEEKIVVSKVKSHEAECDHKQEEEKIVVSKVNSHEAECDHKQEEEKIVVSKVNSHEAECDHKQEEEKKDKVVVSKVKSHEAEFIGTTDESHLLNLPVGVLEMIMAYSVGVEYMNFRASCKLCYLAAPIIKWSNLQLQAYSLVSPWLMVFGKHTITLIDPMFGDKYFIKTPRELELISELKIHCSRYGWLLMRKDDRPLFFFNPLTSDTRELPRGPYLESFDFSAPPTSPDCMVVGFGYECHVYILFVGRESSWRKYALSFGNDDPYLYRYPTFYGGDVYALCNGKGVDVFKELGVEDDKLIWDCVLKESPISQCTSKAQHFLVKCDHKYKCDQHLILVIVSESGESVEVLRPNEDTDEWEKIDDIGRHMIYIDDKTCLCMEAKTSKMENKIYFRRLHSGKIVNAFVSAAEEFTSEGVPNAHGKILGGISAIKAGFYSRADDEFR